MPVCVYCNEETLAAFMSTENPRMCRDCWGARDMDRFTEYEPMKKPEAEDNERSE